jgi:hypothetical protein
MNNQSGSTPLVLLCPAWKRWSKARTVKPRTIILHSEADDVIPIADSRELLRASGLPESALVVVGTDHRLADPEPLKAMLESCEKAGSSVSHPWGERPGYNNLGDEVKTHSCSERRRGSRAMSDVAERHEALTAVRSEAYAGLFGCMPSAIFSPHALFKRPDERFPIDVLVYTLETESGDIDVAVTNGMSDQRMADSGGPHEWHRRELVQYFPRCTEDHARRLHDMAWLPLFDRFYLDSHHSISWPHPAVAGTPWKNASFLLPIVRSHRDFRFEVEGDEASFLWHIPISDEEWAYQRRHGPEALIDRMQAVGLPWVFDEGNRPALVE